MSWASRRQFSYGTAIGLFFLVLFAIPFALWLYEPATCFDGTQNQGETAVDKSGPCQLLDERTLIPHAILWSRGLEVREGMYSAVGYVENPNAEAGVARVGYRFGLYDEKNVLIAEREGFTYVMPGGLTPVFQGAIETGNRKVIRTYLEFTGPLVWERMHNRTKELSISNKSVTNVIEAPRLTALVKNNAVIGFTDISFVAVIFDTAGNAFAGSETLLPRIAPGETKEIVFTWPTPFDYTVGRVDVLPLLPPGPFIGN
ncbi:hypothetical protein C4585_02320 [Candidatus Parcubacteria bacterium]|nr:MAG: hypothetical protein C4585_02320 [Candidatus Parcubacteria bacterium]